MKAAWNLFKEEELPLIRTNLKSDTASIAKEALQKIKTIFIDNTETEPLFNIIGFKPKSNKWIPDEESQLLALARAVEENIGIQLLTEVEQNLQENSENSTISPLQNPDHQSSAFINKIRPDAPTDDEEDDATTVTTNKQHNISPAKLEQQNIKHPTTFNDHAIDLTTIMTAIIKMNETMNNQIRLQMDQAERADQLAIQQAEQFEEREKRARERAENQARLAEEIADYRITQQQQSEEKYHFQNRQLQIHLANKLEQSKLDIQYKTSRELRRIRRKKEGKSNPDGPSSDEDDDHSTERITILDDSKPLTDEQKEENLKIDQMMNLGITLTREEAKVRIMRIKRNTQHEDQSRELGGESTITSRHLKSIKSFDLGPISVDSDKNPAQFIQPFTDLRAIKKEGGKIIKKKTSNFCKKDLALIGIHPLAESHSNIFEIRDKSEHYKKLIESSKNSFWRSNNSSFFKHAMETMHRIGNSIIRQHMNMTCDNPFLYLTTWHALVESLMTETEYSTWYMYYESLPQAQTKHMTLIEKISAISEVIDQPAVSARTVIASNLQQVNQNQQQNEPLEAYIRRWELNLLMAYGVTKDDYDTKLNDQTIGQCQIKFLGGLANRKFADFVITNLTDIKLKPSNSISMWFVPLKMFIDRIKINDRQFFHDKRETEITSDMIRATSLGTVQYHDDSDISCDNHYNRHDETSDDYDQDTNRSHEYITSYTEQGIYPEQFHDESHQNNFDGLFNSNEQVEFPQHNDDIIQHYTQNNEINTHYTDEHNHDNELHTHDFDHSHNNNNYNYFTEESTCDSTQQPKQHVTFDDEFEPPQNSFNDLDDRFINNGEYDSKPQNYTENFEAEQDQQPECHENHQQSYETETYDNNNDINTGFSPRTQVSSNTLEYNQSTIGSNVILAMSQEPNTTEKVNNDDASNQDCAYQKLNQAFNDTIV